MNLSGPGADVEAVLPRVLALRAAQTPDRLLLRTVEGQVRTAGELHAGALRWSAVYQRYGVRPGDTVVLMMTTDALAYEAWLGVSWAGAIAVPLNVQYRGNMLEHFLRLSGARLAVVSAQLCDRFATPQRQGELTTVLVVGDGDTSGLPYLVRDAASSLASTPVPDPAPEPPGVHDPCAILATSGTTGPSKGVVVPWGQLFASTINLPGVRELGPDDGYYAPYPLSHLSGPMALCAVAHAGGHVVIRDRFSASRIWREASEFGCTFALLHGPMAKFALDQPPQPDDAANTIRTITVSPLIQDIEAFAQRFDVEVHTVYSMTEISCPLSAPLRELASPASCGRPRPGCEVRIVDELDRALPDGAVGELVVRTDEPWTLMSGYWNMPEATVAAWRNQWFHTGDAFRRDSQGNYFFVDRFKDTIRRRGENISSQEIEAEVQAHEAVLECAAVGLPSPHGEDDLKVVVVLREGHVLDEADLVASLRTKVPRFMVPRYVEIVSDLPRTALGKVQKAVLRARGVTAGTWDGEHAAPASRAGR